MCSSLSSAWGLVILPKGGSHQLPRRRSFCATAEGHLASLCLTFLAFFLSDRAFRPPPATERDAKSPACVEAATNPNHILRSLFVFSKSFLTEGVPLQRAAMHPLAFSRFIEKGPPPHNSQLSPGVILSPSFSCLSYPLRMLLSSRLCLHAGTAIRAFSRRIGFLPT